MYKIIDIHAFFKNGLISQFFSNLSIFKDLHDGRDFGFVQQLNLHRDDGSDGYQECPEEILS